MSAEVAEFEEYDHSLEEFNRRDDYASVRVPDHAKRGANAIFFVLAGIATAFFWPLVGGIFVKQYGAVETWLALIFSFAFMIPLVLITSSAASREGLTSGLMTRGCGFGIAGGTLTGVIYAINFIILAAAEGQILSSQVASVTSIPQIYWDIIVGLLFIPLVWGGVNAVIKVTAWTVPVYPFVIGAAIWIAFRNAPGFDVSEVFTYQPAESVGAFVGLATIIGAFASIVGLNPLEVPDYGRFIRRREFKKKAFGAIVAPFIIIFFVAVPLGIFFTLATDEINPGIYFVSLLGVIVGVLLAWLSQTRVNVTSLHLGSIAMSSVSEVVTGGAHLGRRFWLVIITVLVVLLMISDIISNLTVFLQWNGILLLSWSGCIIADLVFVRRLFKIVTGPIEYREEKIRRFNPVGVCALLAATLVGSGIWFFAENPIVHGFAAYIAFFVAVITHTTMAYLTKGRYYYK